MRWYGLVLLSAAILAGVLSALAVRRGTRPVGPPRAKHIVLVGASIGQGWQLDGWASRMGIKGFTAESIPVWAFDKSPAVDELLLRPRVRFRMGRAYFKSLFQSPPLPDIVILKECSSYFPGRQDEYAAMVRRWVSQLRKRDIQPVLATVVPVTQARANRDAGKQEAILLYNRWIRRYAEEQGLAVLDLEAALRTQRESWLKEEFAAQDGSHLVTAAYAVLDHELLALLRPQARTTAGRGPN